MALPAGAIIECRASATASNLNAGGFNTVNANFSTDLAATSGNTATPVVTSAAYTFVAGDVNAWIYVKSGTNWTAGFYQIVSVSAGAATLNANIGAAVQYNATTDMWQPSTVAGCATTGSPTGGTYGVDYSQADAAILGPTNDGTSTASTNFSSALSTFTKAMIGNYLHLTSGTGVTTGWYEIVNFVDVNNLTLDRASGTYTLGVGRIGGAMSLNSTLDDDLFEIAIAGNIFFLKNGSFSLGESVSIAAAGAATGMIKIIGYNSVRGDNPTGSTRPLITGGSSTFTMGAFWSIRSVHLTTTGTTVLTGGSNCRVIDCKLRNLSTSANQNAFAPGSNNLLQNVELISYRGRGINFGANQNLDIISCMFHASNQGMVVGVTTSPISVQYSVFMDCATDLVAVTAANTSATWFINNLFYGLENKKADGLDLATGVTNTRVYNNIFYGLTNGITHADAGQNVGFGDYNNYFNNTTNVTNWYQGPHDTALDPTFTSVTQIAGTAGKFAAGNVTLQDDTKNFTALGVVASTPPTHYLGIYSGTGATAGYAGITGISTTTNTNDTLTVDINIGTNTTADKVYSITIGNNFAIGTNLKALGFPGVSADGNSTGYMDIGPFQRQEAGSGGGGQRVIGS